MSVREMQEPALPSDSSLWRAPTEQELSSLEASLCEEALSASTGGPPLRAYLVRGVADSQAPERYSGSEDGGGQGWGQVGTPLQVHMEEVRITPYNWTDTVHMAVLNRRPSYVILVTRIPTAAINQPIVICDTLRPDGKFRRIGLTKGPQGSSWLPDERLPDAPPPFLYWEVHPVPPLPLSEANGVILSKLAQLAQEYREQQTISTEMYPVGRGRCVLSYETEATGPELSTSLKDVDYNAMGSPISSLEDIERAAAAGCPYLFGSFLSVISRSEAGLEAMQRASEYTSGPIPEGCRQMALACLVDSRSLAIRQILVWDPEMVEEEAQDPRQEWRSLPVPPGARLHVGERGTWFELQINMDTGSVIDVTKPEPLPHAVAAES